MNLQNLWILVVPLNAVFLIQIIVRLQSYVKKTNFIKFAILLHILELIWHISALFNGIPETPEVYILLKMMRYTMVFIPSALLMVALSIDETYVVKRSDLWMVFFPPLVFYIALNLAETSYLLYDNFFLALTTTSRFYTFSVLINMIYYFTFVLIMLMNMDRFYRLSKHRNLYFILSFLGSTVPSLIAYLIGFNMVSTNVDTFSLFVPLWTIGLYFTMILPRLRFFDSVQLSNMINNIDYPIAIFDMKGRRLGFNIAYRDDIYPHTDFSLLEKLHLRQHNEPILFIKNRYYQAIQEELYNEGKNYATAVYFNDVTSLRKSILESEEKVRKLDELNDQLLEDMVIQEKLIQETNRQEVFDAIQQDLVASYQHALDRLLKEKSDETLDEVKADLQGTLMMLRRIVKELRSQAEEIMDIGRLIETCVTLYDPQRLEIKITPSPDLTVLTFAQASAIYLAVRQILDFASMQPQCHAADIVLRKEAGRPILVTGLRCSRKIEDNVISEFERNVFYRGSKKTAGLNIMNSDDGCIIYAVLEP